MPNQKLQSLSNFKKLGRLSRVSLLFSLLLTISASAVPHFNSPEGIITGKVSNERGEPLSGVTVQVRGAKSSVVSNTDGSFSINVPGNSGTLIFSYVGMQKQEVSVSDNNNNIVVQLNAVESSLEDV